MEAKLMRGERQLQAAFLEAEKAAARNEDKGDWRRWSIKRLFEKLEEEVLEYEQAVRDCDPRRVREELGDVIWVATMIADHDMALGDLEEEEMRKLSLRDRILRRFLREAYESGYVHGWNAAEKWAFNQGWEQAIELYSKAAASEKVKNYHLGEE